MEPVIIDPAFLPHIRENLLSQEEIKKEVDYQKVYEIAKPYIDKFIKLINKNLTEKTNISVIKTQVKTPQPYKWGIFKQPDLVETVYVLYVKQSVCRIEFNEEIGDMTTQQFMKIIENTYSKCYTATMMCELEFDEKDNSFLAFTLKLVPTI